MAFLLALLIWLIALVSILQLSQGVGSMPAAISEAGRQIDGQFFLTLAITGVVFVLAQFLLGLFIWRFRGQRRGEARYSHGNNLIEAGGTIVTAVVFITLAVMGQKVWAGLHLSDLTEEPVRIEITGEQFAWNVRYPGLDGRFGRTSPALYDAIANPVGIEPDDPAGRDDVVMLNQLVVPVDRTVELRLRSKDVLHSFFMPSLRIKQDTVPGLEVPLRFKAEEAGSFEIACAELCGLGHYRMRGFLEIKEPAEFDTWLAEQETAAGE